MAGDISGGGEWIGKLCALKKEIMLMENVNKRVTFAAGTTGAASSGFKLFTVTGTVLATVIAVCQTDVVKAGGTTLEVGTADSTAELIGQIADPDTIDAGMVVVNGDVGTEVLYSALTYRLINGSDIGYTIGGSNLNSGVIDFYCFWYPVTDGAGVVEAGVAVAL